MKKEFTCIKNYYYGGERITFTKGKTYKCVPQKILGTNIDLGWEFLDDEGDYFIIREDEMREFFGNQFKFGR